MAFPKHLVDAEAHAANFNALHNALVEQYTTDLAAVKADVVIPTGVITMWSGEIKKIPQGWSLCDGTNDTPDLRNRFVMGAGGTRAVNESGGTVNHNHGVTVNPTTLTVAQMPAHGHSITAGRTTYESDNTVQTLVPGMVRPNGTDTRNSNLTGGGGSHTHTATSANTTVLPPFYALAYIMKL